MKYFSIKELENFSGIKAHTLRIWEKRYGILKPQRSIGNTRSYHLTEVRMLLNIALLNKNGYKISDLASLNITALENKAASLSNIDNKLAFAINKLICNMFSTDIFEFEKVLDESIVSFGLDTTIKRAIIPFLEKVNILSYLNTSNEVHFIVTATRKKIIFGIETAHPIFDIKKTVLLFLPEKEHFDLILLYMTYIIKNLGYKVLYMGTNISLQNLKQVNDQKKPDIICTYLNQKQKFKINEMLFNLNEALPETKILVAFSEELLKEKSNYKNISYIHYNNFADFF